MALPLFWGHVGSGPCRLTQRGMRLHAQVVCCAKVGQQDLPITSNKQITRLNILMHQTVVMDILESSSSLLYIGNKFFHEGYAATAVGFAEEIENGLWGILHHKIGLFAFW